MAADVALRLQRARARHKASSFIVSLELVVLICDTVQIMRGCPLRRRRRRRQCSVKPAPASRSLLRALLAAANGAGCKAGGVILAHWLQAAAVRRRRRRRHAQWRLQVVGLLSPVVFCLEALAARLAVGSSRREWPGCNLVYVCVVIVYFIVAPG